jgi:hypothetical protein
MIEAAQSRKIGNIFFSSQLLLKDSSIGYSSVYSLLLVVVFCCCVSIVYSQPISVVACPIVISFRCRLIDWSLLPSFLIRYFTSSFSFFSHSFMILLAKRATRKTTLNSEKNQGRRNISFTWWMTSEGGLLSPQHVMLNVHEQWSVKFAPSADGGSRDVATAVKNRPIRETKS